MQLLLAIVQDEDADTLCKRLNRKGFRVTRISTVGGFLARGNVTILVGVEDEQIDAVLGVIRATCHPGAVTSTPRRWAPNRSISRWLRPPCPWRSRLVGRPC